MKMDYVVYRKVASRILQVGKTRREVAEQLGISDSTLYNKLCKITPFTLEEAIQLKEILGAPGSLEDFFEKHMR